MKSDAVEAGKDAHAQWTAFNHAELECADAKPAFLQGDEQEMQGTDVVHLRELDEIACAMNIPFGSAVRLANAVYGLGNALRIWWLSVDRFFTLTGRRTRTDPIV